jgi:hypothetical protein
MRVTPEADFPAEFEGLRRPVAPPSIDATGAHFRVVTDLDYGVIILPRAFQPMRQRMML